jgi:hypothetical protein
MRRHLLIAALTLSCALSVRAQSSSSGTSTESGGSSDFPGQDCSITTSALPVATLNTPYSNTIQTAFCTAPVTFSIISGSLPTWVSTAWPNATGIIAGTPDLTGIASFTVRALDALGQSAIFDVALSVTSTSGAGVPLAPDTALTSWDRSLAGTPNNGVTLCVGTPANAALLPGGACNTSYSGDSVGLTSALNAVQCGNVINLANTVVLGDIVIPTGARTTCDAAHYIWFALHDLSDPIFPAEHTRVDPSYAGIPLAALSGYLYPGANGAPNTASRHVAQALGSNTDRGVISLSVPANGANTPSIAYWRFIGGQLGRDATSDLRTAIVSLDFQPANSGQDCALSGTGITALPVNAVACMNDQPNHIIFDRVIFQGDAQKQTTRGIALGGSRFVSIQDSYGYDIKLSFAGGGGDAQFYGGGFGHGYTNTGRWIFENNFTASSTMSSLFCGAFVEPKSPATGFDGIPASIIFDRDYLWKNPLWDTQIGQSLNETINIEGQNYPPAGDQEIVFQPAAVQVQQGTAFTLHNTWINDSAGGLDRFTDSPVAFGSGTVTVDGVSYTTVNSANGIITKAGAHNVGVQPWLLQNIIGWSYTACLGPANPIAACTAATTAGAHTLVFNRVQLDGRFATLGNNRTISSTVTVTVTTGAPVNQIALSPSAPDLRIQPSYADAFNNKRTFGYVFFAEKNFTSVSLTWKVDGVANGNSTVGQICSVTSVPCTAPGANDASVVYVSGTAGASSLGSHIISVTSAAGTTTSQVINVSTSSPIWAYDLKTFTSKNGWEEKCGGRTELKNSLVENGWGSQGNGNGQNGSMALTQVGNQSNQATDGSGANVGYGPVYISDLNVHDTHFLHFGGGVVAAALNSGLGIHRLLYNNVLGEDINASRWSHGFIKTSGTNFAQVSGTASATKVLPWTSAATPLANDINFNKLTIVGGTPAQPGFGTCLSINNNNAQFQMGPFSITNSIIACPGSTTFTNNFGDANDCNAAAGATTSNTESLAMQGAGYSPAKPCTSTYSLQRNALADNTAAPGNFTSVIWQPTSTASDLFANYNAGSGGNYLVCTAPGFPLPACTGGTYASGGARDSSDGSELGANVANIYASDAKVRWGNSSPMTISTATLPKATHGVAYSQTLTVSGGTGPYTWTLPGGVIPPGAVDTLDYASMPLPDRNNFHLNGPSNPKYFVVQGGLQLWIKGPTGNPWDGELVTDKYVSQWFTEKTWSNPSSFKMYVNPVALWARYHVPGADDVVYTPGPNKYSSTDNCGLDNLPLIDNLGVRGELTGPFTDVAWQTDCISAGGTLATCNIPDNTPYLLAQKWTKCTANNIFNCTTEEDYWLVKGYGQAQWCPKTLTGGVYVTGTCSTTQSKVPGGAPTPNFACKIPTLPISNGLPAGTLQASSPSLNLIDSTGVIIGTPLAAGSSTFTVQVEDSLGRTANKTFTLTVQ